jgi:hypothetical protein
MPVDPVVMVVPPECGVPPLAEDWQPEVPRRCAPRGAAVPSGPEFRAGGAVLEGILPLAILPPSDLTPPNLAAGSPGGSVATARDPPRLGRRQLPSAVLEPLPQHVGEAVCRCLSVNRAAALIRVADEARVPSPVRLDPLVNPALHHVVQTHRGQEGGYRAPWRGPGHRGAPLAICGEPPSLEPLLNQPPPRTGITPRRHHPDPPVMVNGGKDRGEVGGDDPGVSATWAGDGPCIPGRQGSTMWTRPLATAPAVLRIDRGAASRPRPWQPCIGYGGNSPRPRGAIPVGTRGSADELGAVPRRLQPLHAVEDGLVHVLRVGVRTHVGHPGGGLLPAVLPARLQTGLVTPPREMAAPIPLLTGGLLRDARQGGWPGGSEPACSGHVSWTGCVFRSAPAPGARRARLRGL